jgi:ADP-ribose pyrophosphatase YjhB (NUDIX family)
MKAKYLSGKDYLLSLKLVPRLAINLMFVDENNRVLLTKRAIEPLRDLWHFPGAMLLKNESIEECLKRLAKKELGIEMPKEYSLVGVFEDIYDDPRGHFVDVIYKVMANSGIGVKRTEETEDVKFCEIIPTPIFNPHKEILSKLGYR